MITKFKLAEYGDGHSSSIQWYWWRCHRFVLTHDAEIIALIGGGTSPQFIGAIFECDDNVPTSIVASVVFDQFAANQEVELDEPVLLEAGKDYMFGQARLSGTGGHHYIEGIDQHSVLVNNPFNLWLPESNEESIRFNTAGQPSNILGVDYYDMDYPYEKLIPQIGFVYQAPGFEPTTEPPTTEPPDTTTTTTTTTEAPITTTEPPTTTATTEPPEYIYKYVINKDCVDLHQIINYIVDYICNVEITEENRRAISLFQIVSLNQIIDIIITYICHVNEPEDGFKIIKTQDGTVSIQESVDQFLQYLCNVNVDNNFCFTSKDIVDARTLLTHIIEYLCHFDYDSCILEDEESLHEVLNRYVEYICRHNLGENRIFIPKQTTIHNIIDHWIEYITNLPLRYKDDNMFILDVSVEGEGDVISDPSGIHAPEPQPTFEFPYGTTVKLFPFPSDKWEFGYWVGPETITRVDEKIPVDTLHNILNRIIKYLVYIRLIPNCFDDIQTLAPLHEILNSIVDYVCAIPIDRKCIAFSTTIPCTEGVLPLHRIVNGIVNYICEIELDYDCYTNETALQPILFDLDKYLRNVPSPCDDINEYSHISNIDNLHNVLNAIVTYLCVIPANDIVFIDGDYTTVRQFFRELDLYINHIEIDHSFD